MILLMPSLFIRATDDLNKYKRDLLTTPGAIGGGATQTNPVILYDIGSNLANEGTWSPSVWKARLCLGYKKIPFTIHRISLPDIESEAQRIGILPTAIKVADGRNAYTLPAIADPSKEPGGKPTIVVDTIIIAEYLDHAYPDRPKLFPDDSQGSQEAFIAETGNKVLPHVAYLVIPNGVNILDPRDVEYYHRTRPALYGGMALKDVCRDPEERAQRYEQLKAALDEVDRVISKHDTPGSPLSTSIMGSKGPCYADLWLISAFLWSKVVISDRDPGFSSVFDVIQDWNGGRWKSMLQEYQPIIETKGITP